MNDRISELKQEYFKVSQAKRLMLLCLALAVFLVIFWSLNIGPSKVNLKTVFDVIIDLFEPNEALTNGERVIVLRVRLPRICASILAGILLACSGLLMQGVFQNPLVSLFLGTKRVVPQGFYACKSPVSLLCRRQGFFLLL